MNFLALDPGPAETAWVLFDEDVAEARNGRILAFGYDLNQILLDKIARDLDFRAGVGHLAVEMIASYGMPVGREVFETCVWIGRYAEAWGGAFTLVYRKDVKMHLCHNNRAKDGNVRQALLDRWGGRDAAIGRKAAPGPLHGVSGDVWAALGVAVTVADGAVAL